MERAFCCTILITANALNDENYNTYLSVNDDYNLIQLIESCNYLGKEFLLTLVSFLSWQISKEGFYSDDTINNPIFLFALIYLLLKTYNSINETDLKILIDNLNNAQPVDFYQNWWEFDTLHKANLKWEKLGEELYDLTKNVKSKDLKKGLMKISDLVSKK